MSFGHFMLHVQKSYAKIERKSYILWNSKRWRQFWMCIVLGSGSSSYKLLDDVRTAFISFCIFILCFEILVYMRLFLFIRKWRHGVYICFGFIGNSVCVIIFFFFFFSISLKWANARNPIPLARYTFRRRLTTDYWIPESKSRIVNCEVCLFHFVCAERSLSLVVDWFRSFF